jgi:Domain of unknown function (DUF4396)
MLNVIAWASLIIAGASALLIAIDEFKHPQKMWIMNLVWPITALYFSVVAVLGYFTIGQRMTKNVAAMLEQTGTKAPAMKMAAMPETLRWSAIAVSASHCGAGCALADILCEYLVFAFGWKLFGQPIYASYLIDLIVAWLFGIAFQYFMIQPMRQLSPGAALKAAIQADTLSILSFQVGMYSWMAIVYFVLWPGPHLDANQPAFWLMMQVAMIFGFLTTYPMNRWLLKKGVKESMG